METLDVTTKRHEVGTGLFFIAATVTAIIGLKLYLPVLHDADPLGAVNTYAGQVALGAFFEALLAVANIGTAFMMLPVLSRVSSRLGPAYTIFRSLEVVLILVGLVSMLALSSVSQQFTAEGAHDPADYKAIGAALIAVHDWTFIMGPHFMLGINTLIYSYLFLRSGLVPRLSGEAGHDRRIAHPHRGDPGDLRHHRCLLGHYDAHGPAHRSLRDGTRRSVDHQRVQHARSGGLISI
ncbi:MAG: DUF4386 domain-containing protein [Flavobacteriales bacterium]|nr:DUF4386 domain-containing protein [Flavobacteriales bacterium]